MSAATAGTQPGGTAADDVGRPRIHFTPRSGWVNDPLGLTYRDGLYHLFFQYVPDQTVWGPHQRWGHATSPDALHWTEGPVALEPGAGDGGIWSGSIVQPDDEPAALFYTAVDADDPEIGRARVARADDATWTTWTKGDVVAELPDGVPAVVHRDPWVFRDAGRWWMLMGAGLADGTGTALVYRSDDLRTWSYVGLLASRHRDETEPTRTGSAWECPQLFPLGDRWVLLVSVWDPGVLHHVAYAVGDWADGRFTADRWDRLTYGPSAYAGSAFTDGDGTRGVIHWLRGVEDPDGRWASAHSVPHILHLDGDRLVAAPHPAVAARRRPVARLDGATGPRGADVDGTCDVEWLAADGAVLTVADADADGARVLDLSVEGDRLVLTVGDGSWSAPRHGGAVRVLLDGPVVEVFAGGATLAAPVPARSTSVTVSIGAAGAGPAGTAEVFTLV